MNHTTPFRVRDIIHLINAISAVIVAALITVISDNTATVKNYTEFVTTLFLSDALVHCCAFSKLWPVTLYDIHLIYFGHYGCILNFAQKCMIAKACLFMMKNHIKILAQLTYFIISS